MIHDIIKIIFLLIIFIKINRQLTAWLTLIEGIKEILTKKIIKGLPYCIPHEK